MVIMSPILNLHPGLQGRLFWLKLVEVFKYLPSKLHESILKQSLTDSFYII